MHVYNKYCMRKFIEIVEKAEFGSGSLSRATDPSEEIEFKVFALPGTEDEVRAVIDGFKAVYTERAPTKLFAKTTFLCKASRAVAEAISRAVKMARIDGAVTRID